MAPRLLLLVLLLLIFLVRVHLDNLSLAATMLVRITEFFDLAFQATYLFMVDFYAHFGSTLG